MLIKAIRFLFEKLIGNMPEETIGYEKDLCHT